MLSAVLAESGLPFGGMPLATTLSPIDAYAHLMRNVLPHPEYGAVVLSPKDHGLIYHPLMGTSCTKFATDVKAGLLGSLMQVNFSAERGEKFAPSIDIDGTTVRTVSTKIQAGASQGIFFGSHASVVWPLSANNGNTDTLPANALEVAPDSHASIFLQDSGQYFRNQAEIIIVRNQYGVILTTDSDGNMICSAHFFIGRKDDFNGRLGNANVLTNLVSGAGLAMNAKKVQILLASMTENPEIPKSLLLTRFAEYLPITGSAMGQMPPDLVIATAEMEPTEGGSMAYRVLVIKTPRHVEVKNRKVSVGSTASLSAMAMKFGNTYEANPLPLPLVETAVTFARAIGEKN